MGKFYFVNSSYAPNTASGNRLWAFLKLLSQCKIETDVVYFISDKYQHEAPDLPHIHFHYYWKFFPIKNNRVQTFFYVFLFSNLFCKKLRRGDVVYTYGCNELLEKLVKIDGISIYHERTEHPEVSKLKMLNLSQYYEACKRVDKLFVISKNLQSHFISKGVPEDKIQIVNMTVDFTRFENLRKNNIERYIAYCGKATNNKDGVDQLIKAFALIVDEYPDVKLYVIGRPPKESEKTGNLQLVKKLRIQDRVVFTGEMSSEDVPQMLKDAEILALARPASLQAECGFPTKLGEYLLTKNPVAITDVGNISQFLKHGESAMISKPDDPKSFSENLIWLLDHPLEARIIGQNGYRVAIDNFNSEREYSKVISIMFNN